MFWTYGERLPRIWMKLVQASRSFLYSSGTSDTTRNHQKPPVHRPSCPPCPPVHRPSCPPVHLSPVHLSHWTKSFKTSKIQTFKKSNLQKSNLQTFKNSKNQKFKPFKNQKFKHSFYIRSKPSNLQKIKNPQTTYFINEISKVQTFKHWGNIILRHSDLGRSCAAWDYLGALDGVLGPSWGGLGGSWGGLGAVWGRLGELKTLIVHLFLFCKIEVLSTHEHQNVRVRC